MSPRVLAALLPAREETATTVAPPRLELLLADAPERAAGEWESVEVVAAPVGSSLPAPRQLRPHVPVALQRRRDDNWLAARVGRILPDPFGVIFERNWKPLYAFCLSLVGRREEAEDAAQEALARAYSVLSARREQPDLRPWLFQIARNAAIDRLRYSSRTAPDGAIEDHVAGTEDSPGEVLDRRNRLAALLDDLRSLSERQRAALVLRELSGMSHEEIATTLETTPERSKSLTSEARQALGERRAGRALRCDEYRRALARSGTRNPRGHRLVAHHDSCACCSRGHRSPLYSVFPVPFLLPLFARFDGFGGAMIARAAHRASRVFGGGQVAGTGAIAKVAVASALVASAPAIQSAAGVEREPLPGVALLGAGTEDTDHFRGGTTNRDSTHGAAASAGAPERSRSGGARNRSGAQDPDGAGSAPGDGRATLAGVLAGGVPGVAAGVTGAASRLGAEVTHSLEDAARRLPAPAAPGVDLPGAPALDDAGRTLSPSPGARPETPAPAAGGRTPSAPNTPVPAPAPAPRAPEPREPVTTPDVDDLSPDLPSSAELPLGLPGGGR